MIDGVRLQDLIRFSLDPNSIEIKQGEKLPISIVKPLENGLFLVNIKGKLFTASFQSLPQVGRFMAEVVKTDPVLELKLLTKEGDVQSDTLKFKGELLKFDRKVIVELLDKFGFKIDPKEVSPEQIKKMIKDSGIFFENRMANGVDLKDDVKFNLFQKGEGDSASQISKLQIITLLAGLEAYLPIKSEDSDLDDIEIFIRKDTRTGIVIKTHFSKIGDTLIYIRDTGYNLIECVVKSEVDISEELKDVKIDGVRITWKKLDSKEYQDINPVKDALEQIGGFEILA